MKLAGSHATELIVSAHDGDANLYLSVADIGGAMSAKAQGSSASTTVWKLSEA